MRPRIAIPVPHTDLEYSRRTLPEYRAAVESAGGEVIEIALMAANEDVAQCIKHCDGILLPGSPADVDPQKYGAARHPLSAAADAARDNADELAIQDAFNMRKPLLGVCYGLQILNVWRLGTLVQHLETAIPHSAPDGVGSAAKIEHEVQVEIGTLLAQIAGATNFMVNTSHHQAVERVGDGLRVSARSTQDGVIEAVEGTSPDHWILGVQWHPERSYADDSPSKAIFAAFIAAAREWHERQARTARDFETAKRI